MLSVPTVTQMLTVIGAALLATVVLIGLLSLWFDRVRSAPQPVTLAAQIPAQRQGGTKSPVPTR